MGSLLSAAIAVMRTLRALGPSEEGAAASNLMVPA